MFFVLKKIVEFNFLYEVCKVKQTKTSLQKYTPLLLKPMPRAKQRSAKDPILKKTIWLCHSRCYYSMLYQQGNLLTLFSYCYGTKSLIHSQDLLREDTTHSHTSVTLLQYICCFICYAVARLRRIRRARNIQQAGRNICSHIIFVG